VGLNEVVVVLSTRARRDAVALEKVEAARLPASVEVQRLVRGALELPGRSKERILVEIAVVLAPVLEELARRDVSKVIGAFLLLAIAASCGRQAERRVAAPDEHGALNVGVYIACVPALRRRGDVAVDARLLR